MANSGAHTGPSSSLYGSELPGQAAPSNFALRSTSRFLVLFSRHWHGLNPQIWGIKPPLCYVHSSACLTKLLPSLQ